MEVFSRIEEYHKFREKKIKQNKKPPREIRENLSPLGK